MSQEPPSLNRRIGDRLRAARQAQGLSLAQLSERTGGLLTKSRISNYEQGIRRVSLEAAHTLAEALGSVTAAYLLCIEDGNLLSDDEHRLVQSFRRSDRRGKEMILDVARSQSVDARQAKHA